MSRSPRSPSTSGSSPYLVETILRACDVLEAFQSEAELLRLSEVAARASLSRPTTFRILYTLERRGLVERVGDHDYRLAIRSLKRRKYRFGYGSHSAEFAFSREVAESMVQAAKREAVDLLVLDNRYNAKTAIHNAEVFVRERVDLVIEFQADEQIAAPVVSSTLLGANIPLIAVEIPHPGATYYGANNYAAGLIGGRYLARWAKQYWSAKVDEVLLLGLPMSGAVPEARLTGTLVGIREILPDIDDARVLHLNGRGRFGESLDAVRRHLRRSRAREILVAAVNDPSALGALRAFDEAGRAGACAIMGQNASAEAREELRKPGTRLVGSVGYFPERYGEGVISLALDILRKKAVPPAVFTNHQLITPKNVNHFYPNDALGVRSNFGSGPG